MISVTLEEWIAAPQERDGMAFRITRAFVTSGDLYRVIYRGELGPAVKEWKTRYNAFIRSNAPEVELLSKTPHPRKF